MVVVIAMVLKRSEEISRFRLWNATCVVSVCVGSLARRDLLVSLCW